MPASDDSRSRKSLRDGDWMEALDWLRKGAHRGFALGEFEGAAESLGLVRRAYGAGARRVCVVDLYTHRDTGFEHCDRLLVELPAEPEQRAGVFRWALSVGDEPGEDAGQDFLLVNLA